MLYDKRIIDWACAWQLMMAVGLVTGSMQQLHGQELAASVISESSNLYSVLPPAEWSNVESAVDRGLAHLASIQEDDGRFPSEESAQPAVTSLAVMAFLSRGHMPDEGRYGAQISKAIDFVLSTQKRRGYFSLLAGHATCEPRQSGAICDVQPFNRRFDAGRSLRYDQW